MRGAKFFFALLTLVPHESAETMKNSPSARKIPPSGKQPLKPVFSSENFRGKRRFTFVSELSNATI